MRKLPVYLFLMIAQLLVFSCKKEDSTPPPPVDPPAPAYKTRDVQIEVPADTKIDLSTLSVHSLSVNSTVDASGKSKAAFNKGFPSIAYVFNKENRLILAGFITDDAAVINTASTARVLLYFGYGTMLEQYPMTAEFLKGIDQVKGTQEWLTSFDGLFKNDPLVLDKGTFADPLKAAMRKMSGGRKINLPKQNQVIARNQLKKIGDIEVVDNTIKSGLQIQSNDLSKLSFDNKYRRRAHAFLYKVKSKDESNGPAQEFPLESNSFTSLDTIVDPSGGFTSFSGVLGAWIEGKANEFAVMSSGPVSIYLDDKESGAEYRLRIVGPGLPGTNNTITQQEILKLTQLEIETLALDFLLPVMLEVVGNKDDLALIDGSRHLTGPVEDFLEATSAALKVIPGAYDEVRKGKYDMALRKLLEGMYSELNAAMFENMVKLTAGVLEMVAQKKYYIPAGADVMKDAGRKVKILKLIDLGLFANDLARMGTDILSSSQVEEWTVRARGAKVTLLADKDEVVPLEMSRIKCEIKNFAETGGDTHAFFEWSSSGKYGKISDTKGHTNQLAFNSSDHEITYYSDAKLADLKDGDNFEYIYVTAKFGSDVIGRDTIVINVKKETTTFTLPLTPNTNIIERWSTIYNTTEWTCGNPFYTAEFKHRTGAKSYTIRVITKNGTKGSPYPYYPDASNVVDGNFKYRLHIGSLYLVITTSKTRRDQEEEKQLKMLNDVGHQAIEVTVNY